MTVAGASRVEAVQVRYAVIPAAGLGTRFLPATKAVPKELFPIVDTPALQFVVDEAVGAGIEHIVIVVSRAKPAIEAYFEPSPHLLETMRAAGRDDVVERLSAIGREWTVSFVHQDAPLGLGHAVGCARPVVGDSPFAVLLPDELMADSSLLVDMIDLASAVDGSVVALKRMAPEHLGSYGIVEPDERPVERAVDRSGRSTSDASVIPIRGLVEKPTADRAPSDLAVIGRYVLVAEVFDEIAALRPGSGGELQLTDALIAVAGRRSLYGIVSTIGRHDTGTPLGFLVAAVERALEHPGLGPGLRAALEGYLSGGGSDRPDR